MSMKQLILWANDAPDMPLKWVVAETGQVLETGSVDRLEELVALGLDGIETFYPRHDPGTTARIRDFCEARDLLLSGGSDYHGHVGGPTLGMMNVPWSRWERILERCSVPTDETV